MYSVLRPLLFQINPERAHRLSLNLIRLAGSMAPLRGLLRTVYSVPSKPVKAFGLTFPNPIGLAAGYDKDGLGYRGLACLGFGHIEIGTVTPKPQPGNSNPRLFRIPEERALINRLGFPGKGSQFVVARLSGYRPARCILGVNLGKNKDTPLENATEDYLHLLKVFAPKADYLAINVSSPNTVGLRQLQAWQSLSGLLGALAKERSRLQAELNRRVPILVKLSPDLNEGELADALDVILDTEMDGIIATNTTVSRIGLQSPLANESGGLSGAPLRERSTWLLRRINQLVDGKIPVVAVGGVMCAEDVKEKIDAGATLVQIYTGLVYRGPGLVKEILLELAGQGISNSNR